VTSVGLCLGVAALGAVGALARFGLDGFVSARAGRGFPLGTLAVNVSGAFALGLLVGAGLGGDRLVLAGTATIGSYTTFSTWMLESHRLGEGGQRCGLALNLAASVLLGITAVALGRELGMLL
jgi:CrcB protein